MLEKHSTNLGLSLPLTLPFCFQPFSSTWITVFPVFSFYNIGMRYSRRVLYSEDSMYVFTVWVEEMKYALQEWEGKDSHKVINWLPKQCYRWLLRYVTVCPLVSPWQERMDEKELCRNSRHSCTMHPGASTGELLCLGKQRLHYPSSDTRSSLRLLYESRHTIPETKLACIYWEVECSQTNGGASVIGSQHVSLCVLLQP